MKLLFPTWRFHRDGREVMVRDPEELAALPDGFRDTPTAHLDEAEYQERYPTPAASESEDLTIRVCSRCNKPGHNIRTCTERI